jgi:hypothetical protein
MQDYQKDHPFEFDAHLFEVTSPDPAPEVEIASAYSDGPSNSNPSTKNDAKDDDDGVHDWYKAVAGDEEAFDRLFSSIVFVDEPFELGKTYTQTSMPVASIIESSCATSLLCSCGTFSVCDQTLLVSNPRKFSNNTLGPQPAAECCQVE